jgi:phage baseplate assembly protein W
MAERFDTRARRRPAAGDTEQRIDLCAQRHADANRHDADEGAGNMRRDILFPYSTGFDGRTATADLEAHIYHMIEQLLFTSPGERVNRPDFGTGVMQLVFAPNSAELAVATEHLIQSSIQQYLGDLVKPEAVTVTSEEATLTIVVQYVVQRTQQRQVAQFEREV